VSLPFLEWGMEGHPLGPTEVAAGGEPFNSYLAGVEQVLPKRRKAFNYLKKKNV